MGVRTCTLGVHTVGLAHFTCPCLAGEVKHDSVVSIDVVSARIVLLTAFVTAVW